MDRNIIAILRGITPDEAVAVAGVLIDAGITKIEVPLNSPEPFDSIERMIKAFRGKALFGAGTVLKTEDVAHLKAIGSDMIISPNCNVDIIKATKVADMLSFPGVMTPSECFSALDAGADGLKFFPGDLIGPVGLKAMRAVLPAETNCLAVGGASAANFGEWKAAGANGFGIGSALYKAGKSVEEVAYGAREIVAAYDAVFS